VKGPADVAEAVKDAAKAGRASIALQVQREDGRSFVAVPLRPAQAQPRQG
jgi:serine protease Do